MNELQPTKKEQILLFSERLFDPDSCNSNWRRAI